MNLIPSEHHPDRPLDCLIVGGGPAGLNAALVLGRARRRVALIDDGQPRHAVTRATHGFVTRDGASPVELRIAAHTELARYDTVAYYPTRVTSIRHEGDLFVAELDLCAELDGSVARLAARKVILSGGLRETLPAIPGLRECYGRSLFSC